MRFEPKPDTPTTPTQVSEQNTAEPAPKPTPKPDPTPAPTQHPTPRPMYGNRQK